MFEATQKDKEATRMGSIIIVAIVVVLAIVGGLAYKYSGGSKAATSAAPSANAAAAIKDADPARDLRFLSTKMDKDYTGTTAEWLVDLKNASPTLTYSHIKYETTYGAGDNTVLLVNRGEMNATVGPGEDQTVQFRDALYPTGTVWFRVKVTGATASVQ
jgi:hypothetical protein